MKAQVKPHNGTPTLFLNDQPVYANIHLFGGWNPNNMEGTLAAIRRFAANDIHIYSIDALGAEWYGPQPAAPRRYDFSPVVPRLQTALEADPQAMFLLRMSFETRYQDPPWWNTQH